MRTRVRNFTRGLFLSGPRENMPEGTYRRGRGAPQILTSAFISRPGSALLYAIPAQALTRFGGVRFQWAPPTLFRNGIALPTIPQSGRPVFVAFPPSPGRDDWLYVAGGSVPGIKVSPTGVVEQWGISPPPDGTTGALIAVQTQPIDSFDTEAASFKLVDGSDAQSNPPADNSVIFIDMGSLRIPVDINSSVAYQRAFPSPLDLTKTTSPVNPVASSDDDYIEMWVHMANPQKVEQITLSFWVGEIPADSPADTDVVNNMFTREILIEDTVTQKQIRKERGLGDLVPVTNQDAAFMDLQHPHPETLSLQEQLGTVKAVATRHTWTRLRMPKSTFHRSGNNGVGWEDIRGIQIGVRTNHIGAIGSHTNLYFDACILVGSVGMQGDYQYRFTFANAGVGPGPGDVNTVRSNPNPAVTQLTVTGAVRQGIALSAIPVSPDPQVSHVEIWRTLGNGAIWFFAGSVVNGVTTFNDTVADYPGIFGNTTTPPPPTTFLSDVILPFDNIFPAPGTKNAFATGAADAVGPHYGRMFWTRDGGGGSGRVYYSGAGRPDHVSAFIEVSTEEDPTQKLVRWNDTLYLFTEKTVYEIMGTDEPFIARKVLGVPGTFFPYTVAITPVGLFYRSADGIRLFDGTNSYRIGYAAVSPIFEGQAAGDYAPDAAQPAVATGGYGHGEYFYSDGFQTLVWDLAQERWRDPGIPITAFYFESDTGLTIIGALGQTLSFEQPGQVTDAGTPIPFTLEPPAGQIVAATQAMLQWLYVEADTAGQLIVPTLALATRTVLLPAFQTPFQSRVEYQILQEVLTWTVILTGSLIAPITVYGIETDAINIGEVDRVGL